MAKHNELKAPFFDQERLRICAKDFLDRFHPSYSLPIPIEEIIEFQLKIDIVPIPGLQRGFEIDAFLSQDLKSISVDEAIYTGRLNRYRFSLAHETAHRVLHSEIYKELSSNTVADWKRNISSLPDREYRYLESHANAFAGLILVPPTKLAEEFHRAMGKLKEEDLSSTLLPILIASELASVFDVSSQTLQIRLRDDHLN